MDSAFTNIKSFRGIVIFILGEKEFCINLAKVAAIIKPGEVKDYYELYARRLNLMKKYNDTFPFVDVRSTFGFQPKELTTETRIILIDCVFVIIGLYVEKVEEIVTLELKDGINELKFLPLKGNIYLEGIIDYENRSLLYLNLEKICSKTSIDLLSNYYDIKHI